MLNTKTYKDKITLIDASRQIRGSDVDVNWDENFNEIDKEKLIDLLGKSSKELSKALL